MLPRSVFDGSPLQGADTMSLMRKTLRRLCSPMRRRGSAGALNGGAGDAPDSRTAILVKWSLAGFAAGALTILPHELGHYLVYLAIDVPNLALHYESVSWDSQEFWEAVGREDYAAATVSAPIWGVALALAGGPLVTYAMVAACCYGCDRWRPYPVLVAVGYLCPLRIVVALMHGVRVLRGHDPSAGYDELRVAALTGIPVQVLVAFGIIVIAISGAWLARYLPRGRRTMAVVSILAGAGAGTVLYLGYVGPWLLP